MAIHDDPNHESDATSHVLKASEVHKRRKPSGRAARKEQAKTEVAAAGSQADESSSGEAGAPATGQAPAAGHAPSTGHTPATGQASAAGHTPAAGQASATGHIAATGRVAGSTAADDSTQNASVANSAPKAGQGQDGAPARRERSAQLKDGSKGSKDSSKKKGSLARRVVLIVVAVIVGVLLFCVGMLSWDRWMNYDDHADLQGTWFAVGTTVPIIIDENFIMLDDNTRYSYTIDSTAKTVSYSLGNLAGGGHYWFSDDRSTLVIFDGRDFTAMGTALDDLGRAVSDFFVSMGGGTPQLPEGDDVIVLTRSLERTAFATSASSQSGGQSSSATSQDASESSSSASAPNAGGDADATGDGSSQSGSTDGSESSSDTEGQSTSGDGPSSSRGRSTAGVFEVNDVAAPEES